MEKGKTTRKQAAGPLIPAERIEKNILIRCGEKVMLDLDLSNLCDVETRTLVQAVKRNPARFPDDLMFQLTKDELLQ